MTPEAGDRAPWRFALIGAGLVLALIGRAISFSYPGRAPNLRVGAFFLLPFGLLTA